MVKLRKSHKKLRIILCCVLGAVIAVAGVAAIILFTGGLEENGTPDTLENTKTAVPSDVTPSSAAEDEKVYCNTLYYLAYVLEQQDCYHVEAVNVSGASIGKAYTNTTKDYLNGVMIASDITYGMSKSASQTCYVADSDGTLVAYKRTGTGADEDATVTTIAWDDVYADTYYYYRSDYLYIYGEFSTEMTVYLINEDTISEYGEITQNSDGTYSQTFSFSSDAAYYYQYAQYTNGGLDTYPEFKSIQMTVTFDENWQVLKIVTEEETKTPIYGLKIDTSATTTTTFSYGENSIDEDNFAFYESYFEGAMPNATAGGESSGSTTDLRLTVLMSAFSDVLGESGDSFAFTLELADNTYYGVIYLKVDMYADEIMDMIEAKVLISSDDEYTDQDVYIEFAGGEVNVYYSTGFAMTADIDEFTAVINSFTKWIDSSKLAGLIAGSSDSSSGASSSDDSSSSIDLMSLLAGIEMETDSDGNIVTDAGGDFAITIDIDDLLGIGLYVELNFNLSKDAEGAAVYTLIDATLDDVTYNEEGLSLALTLEPTKTDISAIYDKLNTPLDLSEAAESIYALLNCEDIQLDIAIDGEKLYAFINTLTGGEYSDYLEIIKDLDVKITAVADIEGITAMVSLEILQGTNVVADLDVYYGYDGTSKYGAAYIAVNQFMNVECSLKAYCDIADLAESVTEIISLLEGDAAAAASEEGDDGSASVAAIINSLLGIDFNKAIKEIKAGGDTLGVTLDVDYILSLLGIENIGLGQIALAYDYETDANGKIYAGTLSLTASDLGVTAKVYQSDDKAVLPEGTFFDLASLADGVKNAIEIANDIAANGAAFDISGEVQSGDATISLDGKGEVILGAKEYTDGEGVTYTESYVSSVAVDVTLKVTNGLYGNDNADVSVQFVYLADNFYSGAADAFLYIVIDGEGIKITYDEYQSFISDMQSVASIITSLAGSSSSAASSSSFSVTDEDLLAIIDFIINIMADDEIVYNLNSLADMLSSFKLSTNSDGSISLTYTGTDEGQEYKFNVVTVSAANGKLTLATDIADLYAAVYAYDAENSYTSGIIESIAESDTTNSLSGMVYLLYGYIFECIDTADISSVFGSAAYALEFTLDGDASGISALEGVTVYAEATAGAISNHNIYTLDAEMDIDGFAVNLSMALYDGYIYINIIEIGGAEFEDLAVKASADDIYSAIESVVNLIMDKDVLSLVASVADSLSEDDTQAVLQTLADGDGNAAADTKSTIEAVLELLTAILKGNVITVDLDGEQVALVDINAMLSPFGITEDIGSLAIDKILTEGVMTGLEASITADGASKAWLAISGYAADAAKYTSVNYDTSYFGTVSGTFYAGAYMDAGFVSSLADDISTFVKDGVKTSEGQTTGVEYTLAGDISVPISYSVISAEVNITGIELTIGYNTDDGLYINMFGYVNSSSYLSFTVSVARYIGVSYSTNTGLLTLARGLNSDGSAADSTIYWTMTLEWFIDNMMSSDNSPLRFLLGTSNTAWSIITSAVGLSLSSGLADAEEYCLYNTSSSGGAVDIFGSNGYIASFIAMLSNKEIGSYGDYSGLVSGLGLSDYSAGYYAFELGSGLLGDTLSPVYLALTRSNRYGLGGILAYLAIDSYLSVSVDLEYKGGSYSAKTADYYAMAVDTLTEAPDTENGGGTTSSNDYDYYKFGSVYIEGGECTYHDSYCLADDYVTVYVYETDGDGNYSWTGEKITLRYGSTVYLYTLESDGIIVNADGNAVVYVTEDDLSGLESGSVDESDLATYITLDDSVISYDNSAKTYYINLYEYVTSSTVYTVNMYDSVSGDIVNTSYVFGDQDVTELYGDYTLIGDLYTDENCTQKVTSAEVSAIAGNNITVNLYGKFVQNEVTINGVTYTFGQSDSDSYSYTYDGYTYSTGITIDGVSEGYYAVTGYDGSYGGDWLIIESSINGYDVVAIEGEVFSMDGTNLASTPANIVMPETLVYVHGRAFYKNTSVENIIFLADKVYFNNDNAGSSGVNRYPFMSCNSSLTVYYNDYASLGEGDSADKYYYAFNYSAGKSGDISSSTLVNYTTEWTYYSGVSVTTAASLGYEKEDIESYIAETLEKNSYNESLYKAHGAYFYTSSLDGICGDLENALHEAIEAYTAEYEGYINGFTVEVADDGYKLAVTVKATNDPYYKVTVVNTLYNSQSGEYDEWNLSLDEYTALSDGMQLTYTDGTEYVVVTCAGEAEIYDGDLYIPDGTPAVTGKNVDYSMKYEYTNYTLTLKWTEVAKSDYTVTVYSDIAYTLSGAAVASGEQTIDLETETATLDGKTVATTEDNYCFLGWAYDNGGTLTFASGITYSDSVVYYAIWGYNASVALSDYSAADGTDLPVPSVSGGAFYKWYTDSAYTAAVTELSSGVYTYYARMSFTLTLEFYGSMYYVYATDNETQDVGSSNTSKYVEYTIYEGDSIAVEITDSNTYIRICINNAETYSCYAIKRTNTLGIWGTSGNRTFNDSADHPVYLNGSDTAIATGETSVYSGTVTADLSIKFCI
ncbi:MAG: hypothetical protein LUD27_05755 [Clostridia bacterium]|nr:hypothetical protein [Clostridia bacterium]